MHFNKEIFQTQQLKKYLSYDGSFATEPGKFNVDFENVKKMLQNIYDFSYNLILIGKCKFWEIQRKYS